MAGEYGFEDDEGTQEQETASSLRAKLKEANARAKEAETLATENQTLKQQIAVGAAGLTLNDAQRNALLAVHSGDLTPDGLRNTAQTLGFIAAPAPVPDDPSLSVHEQIAQSAAGTEVPNADREAEIDAALSKASNQAEFMEIYQRSGRPIAQ